ncbi:trypsin-like peptidase domain-containing protein [Chamaesiphon sp. OTE_8_metabat_110]|uniref:trypsin-like peptidase domain-containing protein n=1 Tax=Chamaesiphon sp. OTE_8_metabat_110 TaxID=2964696 RepID=UPI0037C0043D
MPLVQMVANAATAPEINKIAESITVLISEPGSQGSGVILQHQGDVYTVLTAAHVVKSKNVEYTIVTADGRKHQIISSSIRRAAVDIDLAVVKFRSTVNYPIAKLGDCNLLTGGMALYVGGYPAATQTITKSIFLFREGKISANSTQILEKGYSLIYSNDTLPGMSGGAVLNQNGELVAIHGRGDRNLETGVKTGYNLGIPINRFVTISSNLGVSLDAKLSSIPQSNVLTAGDYLARAAQKSNTQESLANLNSAIKLDPKFAVAYYNRGVLKLFKINDGRGALADLNSAIKLDPKLADAYKYRAAAKDSLNDYQGALTDYNMAVQLNPRDPVAYSSRGGLKRSSLNDYQGALADYNMAVQLNPNSAINYWIRGVLKADKFADHQGALADYDRAIQINPKFPLAYSGRGWLKAKKLNDFRGALADYNRVIQFFPNSTDTYIDRGLLKYEKLGDRPGGIADLQRAVKILKKEKSNASLYKNIVNILKGWGASVK